MIDTTTIILGILALVITIWTIFFVLIFRQAKRMAAALENFFDNIQRDLAPLITDLSNASQKISQLSENVDQKLNQTDALFAVIKDTSEAMAMVSHLIREGVASTTTYVRSAAAGFEAVFDFLSKRIGRGGGKHGE
ncbi:MAG: DUF948 domain-containing protein [Desulfovibrionales bacterium]|nr:DUF948 domain-containing protein [Desulfovibrionales bacterium]